MVQGNFAISRPGPQSAQQHPPPDSKWLRRCCGCIKRDPVGPDHRQSSESLFRKLIEPLRVVAYEARSPGDRRSGRAASRAIELPQHHVADPVPRVFEVGVRFVLDPPLGTLRQVAAKIRAGYVQQRANHSAASGINTRQSRQPCTSHQLQEEGLGLIVLRMTHGDTVGAQGVGRPLQEGVSDPAGCIFYRQISTAGIPFDVSAFHDDSEVQPIGQFAAKRVVAPRRRAELVVEMGDSGNAEPAVFGELTKKEDEGHRV